MPGPKRNQQQVQPPHPLVNEQMKSLQEAMKAQDARMEARIQALMELVQTKMQTDASSVSSAPQTGQEQYRVNQAHSEPLLPRDAPLTDVAMLQCDTQQPNQRRSSFASLPQRERQQDVGEEEEEEAEASAEEDENGNVKSDTVSEVEEAYANGEYSFDLLFQAMDDPRANFMKEIMFSQDRYWLIKRLLFEKEGEHDPSDLHRLAVAFTDKSKTGHFNAGMPHTFRDTFMKGAAFSDWAASFQQMPLTDFITTMTEVLVSEENAVIKDMTLLQEAPNFCKQQVIQAAILQQGENYRTHKTLKVLSWNAVMMRGTLPFLPQQGLTKDAKQEQARALATAIIQKVKEASHPRAKFYLSAKLYSLQYEEIDKQCLSFVFNNVLFIPVQVQKDWKEGLSLSQKQRTLLEPHPCIKSMPADSVHAATREVIYLPLLSLMSNTRSRMNLMSHFKEISFLRSTQAKWNWKPNFLIGQKPWRHDLKQLLNCTAVSEVSSAILKYKTARQKPDNWELDIMLPCLNKDLNDQCEYDYTFQKFEEKPNMSRTVTFEARKSMCFASPNNSYDGGGTPFTISHGADLIRKCHKVASYPRRKSQQANLPKDQKQINSCEETKEVVPELKLNYKPQALRFAGLERSVSQSLFTTNQQSQFSPLLLLRGPTGCYYEGSNPVYREAQPSNIEQEDLLPNGIIAVVNELMGSPAFTNAFDFMIAQVLCEKHLIHSDLGSLAQFSAYKVPAMKTVPYYKPCEGVALLYLHSDGVHHYANVEYLKNPIFLNMFLSSVSNTRNTLLLLERFELFNHYATFTRTAQRIVHAVACFFDGLQWNVSNGNGYIPSIMITGTALDKRANYKKLQEMFQDTDGVTIYQFQECSATQAAFQGQRTTMHKHMFPDFAEHKTIPDNLRAGLVRMGPVSQFFDYPFKQKGIQEWQLRARKGLLMSRYCGQEAMGLPSSDAAPVVIDVDGDVSIKKQLHELSLQLAISLKQSANTHMLVQQLLKEKEEREEDRKKAEAAKKKPE